MRNKVFLSLFISLLLVSCFDSPRITITREYIYYNRWPEGNYQGFKISKIILKDTSVSVFAKDFNKYALENHILDTAFCFSIASKRPRREGYRSEKMYFNKPDSFDHWFNCRNRNDTRDTIGLLDTDTWYLITTLRAHRDDYVYIDNDSKSHVYTIGPTNW